MTSSCQSPKSAVSPSEPSSSDFGCSNKAEYFSSFFTPNSPLSQSCKSGINSLNSDTFGGFQPANIISVSKKSRTSYRRRTFIKTNRFFTFDGKVPTSSQSVSGSRNNSRETITRARLGSNCAHASKKYAKTESIQKDCEGCVSIFESGYSSPSSRSLCQSECGVSCASIDDLSSYERKNQTRIHKKDSCPGLASGRYSCVVVRIITPEVVVWPVRLEGAREVYIFEGHLLEAERLNVGDWIEYEVFDNLTIAYKRIEPVAPTKCYKKVALIKTKIVNIEKLRQDKLERFQYVGESSLVGNVGFYFKDDDIEANRKCYFWITRDMANNNSSQIPNVNWRCVQDPSVVLQLEDEIKSFSKRCEVPRKTVSVAKCRSTISLYQKSDIYTDEVPIGCASYGVIFFRRDHLGFLWSADFGEGMILSCSSFLVGDWVSFVSASIRSAGTSRYLAIDLKHVNPLYPSIAHKATCQIKVPVEVCLYEHKIMFKAEWFGEILDSNDVVTAYNVNVGDRLVVLIQRGKRISNTTRGWTIASVLSVSKKDYINKPVFGCDGYETKMLRYLFQNQKVCEAVQRYDSALATSILNYLDSLSADSLE